MRKVLFFLVILSPASLSFGQLNGFNLFEYQLGNLPREEPGDLSTHYNQLNLRYRYKGLQASLRYEQFLSQLEGSSYFRPTQFQVHYRKDKLEVKAGHLIETLGNGLLLRGYEISGSVFEEEAYRSRYGFYRDILGFSASYSGDIWYMQAIRGKSLVNTLPPNLSADDRRLDLVEGLQTGVTYFGQTLGAILMRQSNPFESELFYSLLFSGSLAGVLSYNLELAHNLDRDLPLLALDGDSRYGVYGSLSITLGSFGMSLEYKDYHDLLIGAGISDPPTTVKEHKYKVLNRSIHVPQLIDESGVQVEGYYTFGNREHLVVNYSRSVNDLSRQFVFSEVFAEFSFYPGRRHQVSLFADYASDDFKFEDRRYAAGSVWDYRFAGRWSGQLHLEYQYIERDLAGRTPLHNGVVILGASKSTRLSVSAVWEITTDPLLTDLPGTPGQEEGPRHYPGLEASYKLNPTNTLSLFAGKRRGGPACTSGICYEVLDFEGIEVRFKTRF